MELIDNLDAVVYVCGDAKNMARDVNQAFIDIFSSVKGTITIETIKIGKLHNYHSSLITIIVLNWDSLIVQCSNASERCRSSGKQCRPRSDCSFKSSLIWATLFAQTCVSQYLNTLW